MLIISTIWFKFRPFGLQCSEAMSVHARLVKFNLSIPRVQKCLALVVCEPRAYHTRSSRGVSARRTSQRCILRENTYTLKFSEGSSYNATAVLSKIRCVKDKHHMQSNRWHDMAIIILCFWSPSPKHHHDIHGHRLDTLISNIASLRQGRHANYYFYKYH